ncbi:MAG: hypothetical protein JWN08_54 [Frankiales bacterium]|jgi:hypothetical protein|nr:hypothetical protein [Frankiales bacterium]
MRTRSLPLSLLALSTAAVLSACTVEDTPAAPGAAVGASAGASVAPSAADTGPTVDTSAVLEVEDQVSEGPTVNVKAAAVTDGGWVVVLSEGGSNVLGAGMVPAGATSSLVQVSLAEILTEETELVARLYDDSNADGLYGAGDKPVSNDDADDDDTDEFPGEQETFSFRGADVINS